MLPESHLDDVVRFDVPAEYARMLWAWLKPVRLTWLWGSDDDDDVFVVAALRVEEDDLARLLRDVEIWLTVSNLPSLTFLLDGREYVLQSRAEVPARRAA
jgi:hypothetical protein